MGGGKGMDLKTTEGGTQLSSGTLFQGMSAFFEDEQFFFVTFFCYEGGFRNCHFSIGIQSVRLIPTVRGIGARLEQNSMG